MNSSSCYGLAPRQGLVVGGLVVEAAVEDADEAVSVVK